jgi:hypothetical protein
VVNVDGDRIALAQLAGHRAGNGQSHAVVGALQPRDLAEVVDESGEHLRFTNP